MAEIILPPEEDNEITPPDLPELNIDKPTENSKVITIEFEAKKTNKVSTKDTNRQLYTTDTDAWFEFRETSLEGADGTYSVVFRNRHDGSTFQRTGNVVNGVAYYKIPHQEIRHAGAWRGQVVYTLGNGDTTASEFDYDVKGHILDGKEVREIVVEDFEMLMSQLRTMRDNASQFQNEAEETISEMIFSGESEIQKAKQVAEESALKAQQAMTDYLAMLGVDVATLGADGKLSADQIPALAINDTFTVETKEEITNLIAQRGDVAILVHDENVSDAYILTEDAPEVLDNWIKLGVSYVAKAGHAEAATNAVNSQKINGHRIVALSQEQYDLGAKDPNTVYLVGDL